MLLHIAVVLAIAAITVASVYNWSWTRKVERSWEEVIPEAEEERDAAFRRWNRQEQLRKQFALAVIVLFVAVGILVAIPVWADAARAWRLSGYGLAAVALFVTVARAEVHNGRHRRYSGTRDSF